MNRSRPGLSQQGLTLVEIIVAIAVFSIIMLALSGTIVSGLQLRRNNTIESQGLAYAASVLEQYKSFWADYDNYSCFHPTQQSGNTAKPKCTALNYWPQIPPLPPIFKSTSAEPHLVTACIETDDTVVDQAACLASDYTPPLRRVTVTLIDKKDNKVIATLLTEIGNPLQ